MNEMVKCKKRVDDLLYRDEVYAIQGAVFDVYKEMGPGFLEAVYQECLDRELATRDIPYEAQKVLGLSYKGTPLAQTYIPDFICYGKIIVELKAASELNDNHLAQVFNYLKATGYRLGLLINFNAHPKTDIRRIIR